MCLIVKPDACDHQRWIYLYEKQWFINEGWRLGLDRLRLCCVFRYLDNFYDQAHRIYDETHGVPYPTSCLLLTS
jgi:hypothetical protein